VVAYRERFEKTDVPDHEWLRSVLAESLVVLTHDHAMRWDPESTTAVYDSTGALFIVRGKRPHPQLADLVVRAAPAIGRFLKRHPRPFIAAIRAVESGSKRSVAIEPLISADDSLLKWKGGRIRKGVEALDAEEE
jgi:hypothetical protein